MNNFFPINPQMHSIAIIRYQNRYIFKKLSPLRPSLSFCVFETSYIVHMNGKYLAIAVFTIPNLMFLSSIYFSFYHKLNQELVPLDFQGCTPIPQRERWDQTLKFIVCIFTDWHATGALVRRPQFYDALAHMLFGPYAYFTVISIPN